MSPQHLVEEIGRRLQVNLALDGFGLARLMIDGHLAVDFELDEPADRLLVCAALGILPAGPRREAVLIELLGASLFGTGLGGCTPAFDAERFELLLWFPLDERHDVEQAVALLENLVAMTETWRTRLAEMGRGPSGAFNGADAAVDASGMSDGPRGADAGFSGGFGADLLRA